EPRSILSPRLFGSSGLDGRQFHRTTSLFDRFARTLGDACNDKRRFDLDLALAKQPNAVLAAAGQACSLQRSVIDHGLGIELACINELLDETQVHLSVILGENVVEATLRDPHVQRHLAAFEALDADARARLGTLLAASSS